MTRVYSNFVDYAQKWQRCVPIVSLTIFILSLSLLLYKMQWSKEYNPILIYWTYATGLASPSFPSGKQVTQIHFLYIIFMK